MTIHIENVKKAFPLPGGNELTALEDISLTIEVGDFIVVLGESGCGKSTLLNLVAGLQHPSVGDIRMNGERVTGPHPTRSLLFQQPSLLPWLNVAQNIVFGCKLRGDTENLQCRTSQLIEIMGLEGFERTYPAELSMGMAQRVCLARSLIGHPEVLLLDEPFAFLDTFNRTHLQQELTDFWQIENFTTIFVTHDIDEAILLGNRIIILGGRPSHIIETFDIDLPYPRDISNPAFFQCRSRIFKSFKESVTKNKQ